MWVVFISFRGCFAMSRVDISRPWVDYSFRILSICFFYPHENKNKKKRGQFPIRRLSGKIRSPPTTATRWSKSLLDAG